MKSYKGSGNSGVTAYEIAENGIVLKFKNDLYLYLYDYVKPGRAHVEEMIQLANSGKGLTTYINQNVKANYKRKWRQLKKA